MTASALSTAATSDRRLRIATLVQRQGALVALILTLVIGQYFYADKGFLGEFNVTNLLRFNSMIALLALGMTFVIITGGIDLSVSSVTVLASVVAANFSGDGPWVAVIMAILTGAAVGLFNGGIIAVFGIQPFIVTLATLLAGRGLALRLADNSVAQLSPEAFTNGFIELNGREIVGYTFDIGERTYGLTITLPVAIVIVAFLLGAVLLNLTRFGRSVLAIGGNEEASRLAGVPIVRTKIAVYVLSGSLAGLAGAILAAQTFSGNPNEAIGWELSAIAAVVVGGTLLTGGLGSVSSTLIGVLLLGFIINLLGAASLNPYWQQVIRGLFLLVVVVLQVRLVGLGRRR
jgi:ribose transport system permease protein